MNRIEATKTWIPLGLAIGLTLSAVGFTWHLATDRAFVGNQIENLKEVNQRQDREIVELKSMLHEIVSGIHRIELELGTLPSRKGKSP